MAKTNSFHVKKINDEINVIVEEERRGHSLVFLIFKSNNWLWYILVLMLSLIIFLSSIYAVSKNIKSSTKIEYESTGVLVTFSSGNRSILNGTPITLEYASKLFDRTVLNEINKGVVVKVREVSFDLGIIVFYSDKTALIKYSNGNYVKVKRMGNDYGINDDGTIKSGAEIVNLSYEYKNNDSLLIQLLYLSDGTIEVTKDNVVFLVRNNDFTSNSDVFYTNLSYVSVLLNNDDNRLYFSHDVVKENDYLIVNGSVHYLVKREKIHDDIEIIYYDNGYAEVIGKYLNILVEKSEHIRYDDYTFYIDSDIKEVNISDFLDVKSLELYNKNNKKVNYIVVLEETDNYLEHDVNKRLLNDYIDFSVYLNNKKVNGILNNRINDLDEYSGLDLSNNTYLLYSGTLDLLETVDIKIGLWISYERITNEYMNSALIGTIKVYVEE